MESVTFPDRRNFCSIHTDCAETSVWTCVGAWLWRSYCCQVATACSASCVHYGTLRFTCLQSRPDQCCSPSMVPIKPRLDIAHLRINTGFTITIIACSTAILAQELLAPLSGGLATAAHDPACHLTLIALHGDRHAEHLSSMMCSDGTGGTVNDPAHPLSRPLPYQCVPVFTCYMGRL